MMIEEHGKTYKWSDIVSRYPDQWAFITDVKEKDGAIETCKVLCICTYDEKVDYIKKYKELGMPFECERTTFAAPNVGVLC